MQPAGRVHSHGTEACPRETSPREASRGHRGGSPALSPVGLWVMGKGQGTSVWHLREGEQVLEPPAGLQVRGTGRPAARGAKAPEAPGRAGSPRRAPAHAGTPDTQAARYRASGAGGARVPGTSSARRLARAAQFRAPAASPRAPAAHRPLASGAGGGGGTILHLVGRRQDQRQTRPQAEIGR